MQRDREFKKCNPLEIQNKPDNKQTMDFLKKLGVKNVAKSSLRQCGVPKPVFHPNGGILFVNKNKVQVIPTKKIDPECETAFQPTKILDKHLKIEAEDEKLDSQMGNLSLREKKEGMFASVKLSFEDRKLFERKLPLVTMMN